MSWGGCDPQPILKGRSLTLRPLSSLDREPLFAAASDPEIWRQHPAHDRHIRSVFDPYFDFLLSRKTALVVMEGVRKTIIGTSSFYLTPESPPCASIGFTFLARAYWGGPANREMKDLMFAHLFNSFDAVWLHVDPANTRSRKATEKLGAVYIDERTLDLGPGPAPFSTYRLDHAKWTPAS
ncbi:GNAT family N-acetyltransferase [Shimia abyssi]|uniref:RimJ/RimL family protein N-acetyltransferase n=1 Tax=Shimia abyssi TaxID=1662395 RepID=A0A2P8FCM8_9RHOB|nr:GNAT family N-acetyltransferase [Shimia abyssi]PSL19467.1 RimJ/RimL family protein N-acetyltransferase [Shimia abyssi]